MNVGGLQNYLKFDFVLWVFDDTILFNMTSKIQLTMY